MNDTAHTYPLHDAINAAKATLPHISKDDVTPVIQTVRITHDTWVATDRYTVCQYTITRPAEGPLAHEKLSDQHILLPREAVEWIAKIVSTKLRQRRGLSDGYTLNVEHHTNDTNNYVQVAIMHDQHCERSQMFDQTKGMYPHVERLIETWKPAHEDMPQHLTPHNLEKITSVAKSIYKDRPLKMEAGHSETGKPGPMKITIGAITALIQPNMPINN